MLQNNDKKALKSGIWYVVSNFVVKGAVFFTTPIFTRILSPGQVGAFSNISAWTNILLVISSLELASSVTFAYFTYKEKLKEYISSVLCLSTVFTSLLYAFVLLFREFFMPLFSLDFYALNLIFLYCIFHPALQMLQIQSRVTFKYKQVTILSLGSVFISTFISLALAILFHDRLFGRITGYYGSLIIFNAIVFAYLLAKGKKITSAYWGFALNISLPMIVHVLGGQLLNSCDRVMITRICGEEKNAIYSIAYICAGILGVIMNALNTAWSPWAYEQMNHHEEHRLKKASRPYILLFAAVVFALLLFAPEIVAVMGGKAYEESIFVIPPVTIGILFQFVYTLYVNIEFFHKKQKFTAIGTAFAAMLNILLNSIFIPLYGYMAAAYTTLVGYAALFFIHYIIVMKMNKTQWYDTKFNLCILGIGTFMIPVCNYLYTNHLLRRILYSFLIISIIAVLFCKRKEIKKIIRSHNLL